MAYNLLTYNILIPILKDIQKLAGGKIEVLGSKTQYLAITYRNGQDQAIIEIRPNSIPGEDNGIWSIWFWKNAYRGVSDIITLDNPNAIQIIVGMIERLHENTNTCKST